MRKLRAASQRDDPIKVQVEVDDHGALWREDSAVWEIIAGELVVQRNSSLAGSSQLLLKQARTRAAEAAGLIRTGDLDNAGHAMIGCSLALAHAARTEAPTKFAPQHQAADLAASIAWEAREPGAEELERLAERIDELDDDEQSGATRLIMDLAVRAGGYAAGLSPQITRRRQRRDLLDPSDAGP